jgi:biotin carboxyl carrier protein
LLRQPLSPEQFYRGYLDILLREFPAKGAHLWLAQGAEFVPLGGSDLGPLKYETDPARKDFLHAKMREAADKQRTEAVAAESEDGLGLTITPLLHGRGGGAVQGVQVCWWDRQAAAGLANGTLHLLDEFGSQCAQMMRSQRLESMSQLSGQLQLMSHFLTELAGAQDLAGAAATVTNRAREAVECDRCSLLVVRPGGALEVAAISNVPSADARSTVARTMVQMVEHAKTAGMPAVFRKASEKTEEKGDLSDYFYHSKMQEVLVLPLQPPGCEMVGSVLFESETAGFFDQNRVTLASSVAAQACVPVRTILLREQMPLHGIMEKIAVWRRQPAHEKKNWLRRRLWIPAAVLLVIALFPVRMQLNGTAKVLPRERALVVAEAQGRVAKVLVTEGAAVKKGDALLELDDTELRKRLEIARQEESRLQAEADRLLLQNERAAAQVAQLAFKRAEHEREYHEDQLRLATLRSPLDGVVMTPDLRSRQGDAVQPGSQLAMVGNPASWDLEVNLPEGDVALLLDRLDKRDAVPVRFKLASLPHRTFHAELSKSENVASASEVVEGKNVFRVLVPLPADEGQGQSFRAGYTGRARFDVGYRPLFYSAMRRFFNWLRTAVLF